MVEYIEYLVGSKTSANDTYGEVEIQTSLNPLGAIGQATGYQRGSRDPQTPVMVIHKIEVVGPIPVTATYFKWHLSWKPKSDVMTLEDPDALDAYHDYRLVNHSHSPIQIRKDHYPPLLAVWPKLYFGYRHNNTGTDVIKFRIWYTIRMVSQSNVLKTIVPQ